MASPTSRATLIDYCLRRLGEPVLEVNVDPDQLEDKVDDALQVYQEFHSDAVVRTYERILIGDSDTSNQYVTLGDDVLYVVRAFPIQSAFGTGRNFFDVKYQMMLNDIADMHNYLGDLAYFEQLQQYMGLLDMKLNGLVHTTFSRNQNRLYIHGDFQDTDIKAGDYIVIECFKTLGPNTHTKVYNDIFVKDYTTALIKQQWGSNLMKFEGMQLPGGVMFNGRQYYDDATAEIQELRERMRLEYETPVDFFVG